MKPALLVAAILAASPFALAWGDPLRAPSGEVLVVPAYPANPAWKQLSDQHNDVMLLHEWIPADQSETDIGDILTEQVFYKLKGMPPGDFLTGFKSRVGAGCAEVRVNGPTPQTENGYPVACLQVYCINQTGAAKDVDIFLKAIGGKDALYVVQREFRRPTKPGAKAGVTTFSKDEIGALQAKMAAQKTADEFLAKQVQLCASLGADGACVGNDAPVAAAAQSDDESFPPFINGTTKAAEVRSKLGAPSTENHNPDGRFVLLYQMPKGVMVAFLFDKAGVLIRARGYAAR